MLIEERLKELKDKINEKVPRGINVTQVEFEGPELVIYTDDPKKNPDAVRYHTVTFDEAIGRNLKVMDATAFALCRDQKMNICVFSIFKQGGLKRVVLGEDEGTLVHC